MDIQTFETWMQAIEARIVALETRPTLEYYGVWQSDRKYKSGSSVSHDGSMWIARRDFDLKRPGFLESGWTLAVKKGKTKDPKLSENYARELIRLVRDHLAATGRSSSTPAAEGQETSNATS